MSEDAASGGMCICVNCRWVDRCQAYHAVERQHGAVHLNEEPDFQPASPRIHVSVLDLPEGGTGIEWDVRGCDSFTEESGRWLRLRPGEPVPG